MKLVIGLGNPGKEYLGTRHNAGFDCVDALAKLAGIRINREECKAEIGGNDKVVLAKPLTFMNLSGESAVCLSSKFLIQPKDLIVIHDDLDIPLGRIRVKFGGGSAGHRGINSIVETLGSIEFARIRVGIGGELKRKDTVNFVLSKFTKEEKELYLASVEKAAEAAVFLLTGSVQEAMNRFNA